MRVGIIAFLHESNTFIREMTGLENFERDVLVEGEEVRARFAEAHHEVGGFFAGLADAGIEAVPLLAARALPHGPVTAEAFATISDRIERAIERAGHLDGLLIAPHGAMVAEHEPDADGEWVSRVRARVGAECPIIATLDLHANLSERLVASCDAILAYRTNPHLDQRVRGMEAATLMMFTLRGQIRPTMAAVHLPMAVNIESQATSEQPCRSLVERASQARLDDRLLSVSLVLGFPYADVPQMGASVVAVTNGDPERARRSAEGLAAAWWGRREEFTGRMIGVEAALDQATRWEGTIGLFDMGDNIGGGSPADGTVLAHALLARPALRPSLVALYDPEAVARAMAAGVGEKVRLSVGGKTDDRHGAPLVADFNVLAQSDGTFRETEPRHGGLTTFDQGPTVVVATDDGFTLLINSRRTAPFSLAQLTSCGIEPRAFRILVAKGVHAPRAAYAPACRHLIRVDTPGSTSANLMHFAYERRRNPMFPFERAAEWACPGPAEAS